MSRLTPCISSTRLRASLIDSTRPRPAASRRPTWPARQLNHRPFDLLLCHQRHHDVLAPAPQRGRARALPVRASCRAPSLRAPPSHRHRARASAARWRQQGSPPGRAARRFPEGAARRAGRARPPHRGDSARSPSPSRAHGRRVPEVEHLAPAAVALVGGDHGELAADAVEDHRADRARPPAAIRCQRLAAGDDRGLQDLRVAG